MIYLIHENSVQTEYQRFKPLVFSVNDCMRGCWLEYTEDQGIYLHKSINGNAN